MDTQVILHHIAAASAELRHCAHSDTRSTEVASAEPDRFIITSLDGDRGIHLLTPDGLGHRLSPAQAHTLGRTLLEHAARFTLHARGSKQ